MADDKPKVIRRDATGKPIGWAGAQAGQDFASNSEMDDKAAEDDYLKSKGWAGLGGAARRPAGWRNSPDFAEFKKKRKKPAITADTQKEALAPPKATE
jgi:hypothetical protein